MLVIFNIVRRTIEGSVVAVLLIGLIALTGASQTIGRILAEPSVASIAFLLVLAIVLADLIGKAIGIVVSTFPDLIPKIDEDAARRASLIQRLRPGQTVALLSGAYAARLVLFLAIFALLGASYAWAPSAVQQSLFGDLGPLEAMLTFLREGIAGSISYFLFFLGPENLRPLTHAIVADPLVPATVDGDILLAGIRVYGLAFVLAILRTLVTPITLARAHRRARHIPTPEQPAPEPAPATGSGLVFQ